MAETRLPWERLVDVLRERAGHVHTRNLILVALPIETAHSDAPRLAEALGADYVDFDAEVLRRMSADDWEDHVAMERRDTLMVGRALIRDWLADELAPRLMRARPLLIGNVNLAVRYEVDVAAALYDATAQGLCVLAAGGRVQGQTLLLHGIHPQTGATSPAYELMPAPDAAPPPPSAATQDRLL